MTDIKEILERAVDVRVAVDVPADLSRGRARVRRERRWAVGALTTGLLLTPVGIVLVSGGSDPEGSSSFARPGPASASTVVPKPTSTPTPDDPTQGSSGTGHTTYYRVPRPPIGWHVVGDQPEYVMIARDGTNPPLTGGFKGKLVIYLTLRGFPQDDGTPIVYHGRTFFHREADGDTALSVRLEDGDWLTAQYPDRAGFAIMRMVSYLDAVTVLPGATGAS